jgi:hypothetical protein
MRPAGSGGQARRGASPKSAPAPALPLPPDERRVAAALLMIAGDRLTEPERLLCLRTVAPGVAPLSWRERLRLSVVAAGQHLPSIAQ